MSRRDPSNSRVCWIEPVGQGSTQRPQNMHFASSMSNCVTTRCFGFAASFSSVIWMQPIGHARSHAWQPVQIAASTSRNPRYRGGSMSRTAIGVRSGYWTVIGRRTRCESVIDSPCQKDTTVSLMAPVYSRTVVVGMVVFRLPLPVAEVDAIADRRDVGLRLLEEERDPDREEDGQRDARDRGELGDARGDDDPEERRDERGEGERDEVLPAERHHLVDADARERPAHPDDEVQDDEGLHDEHGHRGDLEPPPGGARERARAAGRVEDLLAGEGDLPAAEEQ